MNAVSRLLLRFDRAETRWCLRANAASRRRTLRTTFQIVSRLGDGMFWYALIVLMPAMNGTDGWVAAAQMLFAGGLGLLVYKFLKRKLVRERPFIALIGVECALPPLDRYSFPSGHTLHAVTFTTLAVCHVPALAWLLVPFTALVAMSRVVLGLHYPSDVIAGAALGAMLAALAKTLI